MDRKRAEHGTRSCYVGGCRRPECKAANTEYNRNKRAAKRGLASVSSLPGPAAAQEDQNPAPGRVESQVVAELGSLTSPAKFPGLAESCLAMARILDDHRLATTHPSAHRQLQAGLTKLHEASIGRVGKLASVAAMSKRSSTG